MAAVAPHRAAVLARRALRPEWEQAAALPALAERWRATFRKRVDAGRVEDWEPRLCAPASAP
ncbi:3-alpha domain-containing protein [Variovorax boronicumulans]|uniref:3-alpha domain-containing protein n=1 Tax=Variovorax boronicumulans TaxID=436515 RepID=UPI001F0AA921|nr:3-alpha domain-containing protein [Variovorax boronicumulans]